LTNAHAQLVTDRHSTRAYLPTPVADNVLQQIMRLARQAPSGANLQPGNFIALQGAPRQGLSEALVKAWRGAEQEAEDYAYFPNPLPMLLRKRQVAAARALYGALGIERDDAGGRATQFERNFRFFDAPVALLVTLEQEFGNGGYMDLGMALYGLMLGAESLGLSSCAIGALASFPSLIRQQLQLPQTTQIVCGVALGYADPDAPVNRARTARCELDDYFRVVG
jgi:nitroreductase